MKNLVFRIYFFYSYRSHIARTLTSVRGGHIPTLLSTTPWFFFVLHLFFTPTKKRASLLFYTRCVFFPLHTTFFLFLIAKIKTKNRYSTRYALLYQTELSLSFLKKTDIISNTKQRRLQFETVLDAMTFLKFILDWLLKFLLYFTTIQRLQQV